MWEPRGGGQEDLRLGWQYKTQVKIILILVE